VRGSYGCDFIHSPDRLLKPLVKVNGSFEESSWETALQLVATQFQRIKDEYGNNSIAVFGSSKCTNEENYLLQRFARSVLGTNNIDNGGRLYNSASRVGLGASLSFSGTKNYLEDLEQTELILVIGADPNSSAPAVSYAIKRAVKQRGVKLLLIDPRQTKLALFAHLWLRPKVGTDVALINGLAKVIIDEGLLDEEFVARRTDNFEAFNKILKEYTLRYVEEITGVPGQEIRAAAQFYARASQAVIVYGTGITQYITGTDGVKALANLALLTGNIGRKGGGVYALQRENNGQGACDMGTLPKFFPEYQSVVDGQARGRFEERWRASLPAEAGLSALEIMEQAKQKNIKGIYIVGENPVLSFPNSKLITEILDSIDFLVVQDMFITETAKLANVVLPAASFAEKDGTFTNFEGRTNKVCKAIDPIGDSLPDWEIVMRLANKMDYPLPFSSLSDVISEIEGLVSSYEAFTGSERQDELAYSETGRTYGSQFLKGFARFSPTEYTTQSRERTSDYPFTLLTGTILNHLGTGSRSSRSSRLKKFSPEAFVEIYESDAKKLAIADGEKVKIISAISEVTATVKITDVVREGILFIPISFPETPVNELFDIILNPETKAPSLKACSVKIEKITSP